MQARDHSFVFAAVVAWAVSGAGARAERHVDYAATVYADGRVEMVARFDGLGAGGLVDRSVAFFERDDVVERLRVGTRARLLDRSVEDEEGRAFQALQVDESGGWNVPAGTWTVRRTLEVPNRTEGGGLEHPFASSLSPRAGVLRALDLCVVPAKEPETWTSTLTLTLPEGWTAVTPWGTDALYRPPSLDDLLDNFFAVGSDLVDVQMGSPRFRLRVSAPSSLVEAGVDLDAVLRLAHGARKRFGGLTSRNHLVVLQQLSATGHHRALAHRGANAPRSLVAYVDPRSSRVFAEHPLSVVGHELVHWWIARAMNFVAGGHMPWFSEGLTSYYEMLLPVQSELEGPAFAMQALVDAWHASRPRPGVRPWTLEEASAAFSSRPGATELVYQRGAVIGFLLDVELREAGSSLDTVIRKLVISGRLRKSLRSRAILDVVRAEGGDDVLQALRDRLASPSQPDITDALASLGYVIDVTRGPYLGLRFAPAQVPTVEVVVPGGPSAGVLFPGDRLLRLDGVDCPSADAFHARLRDCPADEEVPLTVQRQGETLELMFRMGGRDEPRVRPVEAPTFAQRALLDAVLHGR